MYPPTPDPKPGAPNPYAPPTHDPWSDTAVNFESQPQGNYAGGFAVGLFFSLLGLIIVHITGKEETKRGALHGFGARIGLTFLLVLVISALD